MPTNASTKSHTSPSCKTLFSNRRHHSIMRKSLQALKNLSIAIGTVLLVNCSAPTNNDTMTTDQKNPMDTSCTNDSTKTDGEVVMQSEITCPKCGHKAMEIMPTDVCVIKYNCKKCGEEMRPKEGDCCVFCTHGTHKCPSMQ